MEVRDTVEKSTVESEDNLEGEKVTDESNQGSEEQNPKEVSKQDSEEDRVVDFFTNGDDNLQSFNFMAELPFEFKHIDGSVSGKYFVTFKKPELLKSTSQTKAVSKSTKTDAVTDVVAESTETKAVSESFALRLEGNTPGKFGVGGYIELESDYNIETDPHLHLTLYGRYSPSTFVDIGLGVWGEKFGG